MSDDDKQDEGFEAEGPETIKSDPIDLDVDTAKPSSIRPITMTGSVAAGGAYASSGGMITTTTSSPVWSTSPTWVGSGTSIKATPMDPIKKKKTVAAPPRMTEKVLVAFMDPNQEDENKDIIWAAHLKPIDMQLTFSEDGSRMIIEFSLEDHHGNLEK